jgi:hypothetical protein
MYSRRKVTWRQLCQQGKRSNPFTFLFNGEFIGKVDTNLGHAAKRYRTDLSKESHTWLAGAFL